MCGIFGILSFSSLPELDIYNQISKLKHRGPDEWGYYIENLFLNNGFNNYSLLSKNNKWDSYHEEMSRNKYKEFLDSPFTALGHTRLSIIDLSPGAGQPMVYDEGNLILVFNGEIYNYIEIRKRLIEKGYLFRTNTDSEVILAAYREWGSKCINYFNGMWAFAIYDKIKGELFISRDRLGVKPLFYTYVNNGHLNYFAFASEIKALLDLPGMKKKVNYDMCYKYILHSCVENTEETFFSNVYRLPPATNMFIDINRFDGFNGIKNERYWDLYFELGSQTSIKEKEIEEKKEEFYDLFVDAVKIRLRSDVRIGTALSGGLDSSSNVYVIKKLLEKEKITSIGDVQYSFSSVFNKADEMYADESYYIDLVATKLGVNSVKIVPDAERLKKDVRNLIYYQDEPFGSTSIFAQWCVFSLPRTYNVLVTLDGQGADEQLAGYLPYFGVYWSEFALYSPSLYYEIYSSIKNINGSLKAGLPHMILAKYRKIDKLSIIERILQRRYLIKSNKIFKKEICSKVAKRTSEYREQILQTYSDSLNKRLAFDTQNSLSVLLRYADRNSMAYGIESRGPYLDYRLVEFLASLPSSYKINNGWTKYIARRAFDGKLPDEITWRKDKKGFPTPEKIWFQKHLREWSIDVLKKADFLPEIGVENGKVLNFYDLLIDDFTLWKLINLELWSKVYKIAE